MAKLEFACRFSMASVHKVSLLRENCKTCHHLVYFVVYNLCHDPSVCFPLLKCALIKEKLECVRDCVGVQPLPGTWTVGKL